MVIEALIALVVVLTLAVSAAMALIGLMGAVGDVRFERCSACQHLVVTSAAAPVVACPYCRHPRLLHPVRTAHAAAHPWRAIRALRLGHRAVQERPGVS